jgi:radical SAM superfamily enzyme YgiQ (UPF0313 family)
MLDIVILSVPGTISKVAPAAPALLKASVESAGFSCRTVDFNIRLYRDVDNAVDLETYFTTGLNLEHRPSAVELIEQWVTELCQLNPRYIGISVFTYQNRVATQLFCTAIRQLMPDAKIVVGGQGIADGGIEGESGFAVQLISQSLIDFWIRSEGEISLVELLKGNTTYPGINSNNFEQIENLNILPFPNYDDYDLLQYENANSVPVTGSRGCVRACSFCDIHEHWAYRYRSGQNIADEINYLNQKYGVTEFSFSDSLINGNLKEFKNFIKLLSDRNQQSAEKLTWSSQFIVRSERTVNEQYWQDIADSGARNLAIGVETGSDTVRLHMNKKFTNQDLDYTMQMMTKYNITCQFLIIVGYPTETDADFQDTLDMFTKYQPLIQNVITSVTIGSTLGILPGTPLYHNADLYNIELDKYENNWIAKDNLDLTLEKRLHRRTMLKQHLESLGYAISDSTEHVLKILDSNREMFKKRHELKRLIKIKQAPVPVS